LAQVGFLACREKSGVGVYRYQMKLVIMKWVSSSCGLEFPVDNVTIVGLDHVSYHRICAISTRRRKQSSVIYGPPKHLIAVHDTDKNRGFVLSIIVRTSSSMKGFRPPMLTHIYDQCNNHRYYSGREESGEGHQDPAPFSLFVLPIKPGIRMLQLWTRWTG